MLQDGWILSHKSIQSGEVFLEDWGDGKRLMGVMGKNLALLLFLQVLHEWVPGFGGLLCYGKHYLLAAILAILRFPDLFGMLSEWKRDPFKKGEWGDQPNGNPGFSSLGHGERIHVENRLHLSLGFKAVCLPDSSNGQFLHRSWGGAKFHQVKTPQSLKKKPPSIAVGKSHLITNLRDAALFSKRPAKVWMKWRVLRNRPLDKAGLIFF